MKEKIENLGRFLIKKVGMILFCAIVLFGTVSGHNIAYADNLSDSWYSIPNQRDYVEPYGTHLMMNIGGLLEDNLEAEPFNMKFMQFPLQEDEYITTKQLLFYAQQVVDNGLGSGKYIVKAFEKDAAVEFKYPDHYVKIPLDDKGFTVPNFTKITESPELILVANVILEKMPEKEIGEVELVDIDADEYASEYGGKFSYSNNVKVYHQVVFLKRVGRQIVPASIKRYTDFQEDGHKKGDVIDGELLQNAAQEEFNKSELPKEGYTLIKRVSAIVNEDEGKNIRVIQSTDQGLEFNYVISLKREPSPQYVDSVTEYYYVSKSGDDYVLEMENMKIDFVNESGDVVGFTRLKGDPFKSVQELYEYLKNSNRELIKGKDGNIYSLGQAEILDSANYVVHLNFLKPIEREETLFDKIARYSQDENVREATKDISEGIEAKPLFMVENLKDNENLYGDGSYLEGLLAEIREASMNEVEDKYNYLIADADGKNLEKENGVIEKVNSYSKQEKEASNVESGKMKNPATGDFGIGLAIFSMVSSAGVLLKYRKRK